MKMIKSIFVSIFFCTALSQRVRANPDLPVSDLDEPIQFENCKVDFCAHGDDDIQLDLSQDGGLTYPTNLVSLISAWTTPLIYTYAGALSTNTKFQFTVTDSWYVCMIRIVCCCQTIKVHDLRTAHLQNFTPLSYIHIF